MNHNRQAPPVRAAACPYCGEVGFVQSHSSSTRRVKTKFTVGWLFATLVTFGLALPLWFFSWEKPKPSDIARWNECSACGTEW